MTPTAVEREKVKGEGGHRLRDFFYLLPLIVVLGAALPAFGCPVCWGAPDDPMVKGVNKGIYVLLGLVGVVQIGFAALFWSFWKRARDQRRFRDSLHVIEGGPLQ
jgi:hypothetical protein